MSRVLFLANHDMGLYNFRLELIERLIQDGHEVHVSCPYGERIDDLINIGIIFHNTKIERHGMNPIREVKLISLYKKLMKKIKPDIILGYTIKPNIYGAIAAQKYNIPFIANITGLGTAVENPGIKQKIFIMLYKFAFKKVKKVFFQNEENKELFCKYNIARNSHDMLPGSGVNLKRFPYKEYPNGNVIKIAFISRIMKEKGIDYYLFVAEKIKSLYENIEFHVCGFCEPEYNGKLQDYFEKGIVVYHGAIRNVSEFLEQMHVVIHPSYYPEGMSNVLLEASATGRPIITTDRAGCREIIEDGCNGYRVPQKDENALFAATEQFIKLSWNEKKEMGCNARKKVEREFDRNIVVTKYINEIKQL